MRTKTSGILVASLASTLAIPALAGDKMGDKKSDSKVVHCYGINKCKGVGDCGGEGHSCKGMNSCKGAGYIELDKETCLKIEGGRLTEKMEKMDKKEGKGM